MGGSPKPPDPPKPTVDPRILQAAAEEAAKVRQGRGYRSTILSDFTSQASGGKTTLGA